MNSCDELIAFPLWRFKYAPVHHELWQKRYSEKLFLVAFLTARLNVPIFLSSTPQEKPIRICRCLTEDGQIHYGLQCSEASGTMQVLEGNIFDSLQPTDKYLKIVAYLPPVAPPNIFALGFSYRKHADEIGTNVSPYPVVFIKANTSLTGHETEILLPAAGPDQVDYEGELAVIIGKEGKNIKASEAMNHVLGYTCANDVSARDWQFEKQKGQWTRGCLLYTSDAADE